ncbi:MAG TPA: hypothetical protein VLV81_00915 [Acidimicrobiia bacterium]|nr:hypothetical protein [Acidimicrobiia bacterium]
MPTRLLALAAALVLVGVACSGQSSTAPKPFCESAYRYEAELEREQNSGQLDVPKQISLVRTLAAEAPPAIHADAQRFLQALEQVQSDPSVRKNPTVKRSVDNVNRYASNRCGLFNQQPGGI